MRRVEKTVEFAECQKRALKYLASRHRSELTKASAVGQEIWPDTNMTSQGLGGAASRILRKLDIDGLVDWTSERGDWGYLITAKGRALCQ